MKRLSCALLLALALAACGSARPVTVERGPGDDVGYPGEGTTVVIVDGVTYVVGGDPGVDCVDFEGECISIGDVKNRECGSTNAQADVVVVDGKVVEVICYPPRSAGQDIGEVGEINLGCGSCPNCYAGMQRHCPSRSVLGILNKDGAMAEYVTLPTANLHVVPEHIPDDVAVFTEPLAAACEIAEQVHLVPGMKTMVIGDGKLGLLIVQVLQKYGCDVSLLGRHDNKLEIARSRGATACKKAADLPSSFDLVVEATGASAAFSLALGKVRPRGTLVLKSTYAGNLSVNMAPLVIDEIELIGSRCGRFGPALKMLAQNEVATQNMVSECLALSEAMSAFKLAQQPGVLKVLLKNN